MNRRTIYVAGPIFSYAEKRFNIRLVKSLAEKLPEVNFILPQNHAKEISDQKDFIEKMFKYCVNSIHHADAVLCILDGPDVDSGTAIEMGYAYACKKPIIGFRSDFRSSEDRGMNLMVSRVCTDLLWLPSNRKESEDYILKIVAALKRVLK